MTPLSIFQINSLKQFALLVTCALALCWTQSTLAQTVQDPQPPRGFAGDNLGTPAPPPKGDGSTPPPAISGDTGTSTRPPSGMADTTKGVNNNRSFFNGNAFNRTTIHVYRQTISGGIPRGTREMQTIRLDQLTSQQYSTVLSILNINPPAAGANFNVLASESQLQQLQQVFAPYPAAQLVNGRLVIGSNSPPPGTGFQKPGEANSYTFQGPLPTVATFARYLIILGVVASTIFISIAAVSVVFGNQYGALRVIGAVGGLILLLMSYTIWKVVQMNTMNAMSSPPALLQFKPTTAQVPVLSPVNGVPQSPSTVPTSAPRSGVPLIPLGASQGY